MKTTVSIVTYTALRQAKACIASVLNGEHPEKLILTANGSPDASKYFSDLRAEFPFITVVTTSKNTGFIEPNKFAFSQCDTEAFVMLNDDAIVPPGWLAKFRKEFDRDPEAAIVGQKNACCSLRDNFYGFKGPRYEYAEFSCAAVRTSIMREHGLFSDYIEFASTEDADASLRMRELGYKIACADFGIEHAVGATRKNVPGLAEIFQRNLATCQQRWGDYLKSKDRKFPCER